MYMDFHIPKIWQIFKHKSLISKECTSLGSLQCADDIIDNLRRA